MEMTSGGRKTLWCGLVALLSAWGCDAAADAANASSQGNQSPFPAQIQVVVPFAPTAFPADGGRHLMYELYITSFEDHPVTLSQVKVIDPDQAGRPSVASFSGNALDQITRMAGTSGSMDMGGQAKPISIDAGGTAVLFLSVTLPADMPLPQHVAHRLEFSHGEVVEGAATVTQRTVLKVLAPPVEGTHWQASDGPSNEPSNHHRRGIFVVNGAMRDSRRFAIDWVQVENGARFRGDKHQDGSYYAYNKPVLAVADATVVEVRDGLPDNPPGHNSEFHPALPVTFDNAGGNTIVLDLGEGQFAHYYHLKPGSIAVKAGEHVRAGQVMAHIGASGDAREPHLHFEVTTEAPLLAGEGIPYVIDRFSVIGGTGYPLGNRNEALPLDGMEIDFGARR